MLRTLETEGAIFTRKIRLLVLEISRKKLAGFQNMHN